MAAARTRAAASGAPSALRCCARGLARRGRATRIGAAGPLRRIVRECSRASTTSLACASLRLRLRAARRSMRRFTLGQASRRRPRRVVAVRLAVRAARLRALDSKVRAGPERRDSERRGTCCDHVTSDRVMVEDEDPSKIRLTNRRSRTHFRTSRLVPREWASATGWPLPRAPTARCRRGGRRLSGRGARAHRRNPGRRTIWPGGVQRQVASKRHFS